MSVVAIDGLGAAVDDPHAVVDGELRHRGCDATVGALSCFDAHAGVLIGLVFTVDIARYAHLGEEDEADALLGSLGDVVPHGGDVGIDVAPDGLEVDDRKGKFVGRGGRGFLGKCVNSGIGQGVRQCARAGKCGCADGERATADVCLDEGGKVLSDGGLRCHEVLLSTCLNDSENVRAGLLLPFIQKGSSM